MCIVCLKHVIKLDFIAVCLAAIQCIHHSEFTKAVSPSQHKPLLSITLYIQLATNDTNLYCMTVGLAPINIIVCESYFDIITIQGVDGSIIVLCI